jgi:hypothetical protein
MSDNRPLLGFIAALMHDVRKIDLGPKHRFEHHEDLTRTVNPYLPPGKVDFTALLGEEVVEIAGTHGKLPPIVISDLPQETREALALAEGKTHRPWLPDLEEKAHLALRQAMDEGRTGTVKLALLMADRWCKAMYQVPLDMVEGVDEEERRRLDSIKSKLMVRPTYHPFYGYFQEWEAQHAAGVLLNLAEALGKPRNKKEQKRAQAYPANLNLQRLLGVQAEYLARYPHTSYVPHDSLAGHHRFTALLYLFIHEELKRLASPLDLQGLDFTLLRITPDPQALFYRLRDVQASREALYRLRLALFRAAFVRWRALIPDLEWHTNPFEFYGGDEVILVLDQPTCDRVTGALEVFVDQDEEIQAVHVERLDVHLPDGWKIGMHRDGPTLDFYASARQVKPEERRWLIAGESLSNFPAVTERLCQRCNRPGELALTEQGDWLCADCRKVRKPGSGVDLEKVAGEDLLGFVFLAFPDRLRKHALEAAAGRLIPHFVTRKGLEFGLIASSPTGFFEYLQALADLDRLRRFLEKAIGDLQERAPEAARVLYATSTRLGYVLRWERAWTFIGRLNAERKEERLALDTALTVVFCRHQMPFWTLMDRFAHYRPPRNGRPADRYYDATGRSVVMFTPGEVNSIRQLANAAARERVTNAQLRSLVQMALMTGVHELDMELDARAKEGKMGRDFPSRLKAALSRLTYEEENENKRRQKRAVFIKYVIRLKGGR